MYYPYLRGKQFEYAALRELCNVLDEKQRRCIVPIVEPVKMDVRDVGKTAIRMKEAAMHFAYVMNPMLGDYKHGMEAYDHSVRDILPIDKDFWLPAFILHPKQKRKIIEQIEAYARKDIMVILPKDEDVSLWDDVMRNGNVATIVTCNAESRSVTRKISRYGKSMVRLDDCFQQEKRNADYRDKEDQFFNDNHLYYKEENMAGCGDYTTLPSLFIEGGMLPYVVAIHLTYRRDDGELWIRHFLSDTNDGGQENIQAKFGEAVKKALSFFDKHKEDCTPAVEQLRQYFDDGHYPGLGMLKKLSIEHHVTLMGRFESGNVKQ